MQRLMVLIAATAGLAAPALANDSTAELTTGGLVLKRTEHIEMRSEDLYVSPTRIKVTYRFLNTSTSDITTTVAFPMPDIEIGPASNIAVPNSEGDNLLNFATRTDGAPVKAKLEQKAMLKGVDHSAHLRRLGVPLNALSPAATRVMDALPQAEKDRLLAMGLAEIEEFDAGRGWERHMAPRWTLKTTYYWDQTFPAGREITVEHAYEPSVGGSVDTALGASWSTPAEQAQLRARYCIDDAFMAAVRKRRAAHGSDGASGFTEKRIDYVLTTGANWKTPIGDFRLVVDKGEPDRIVSFCGEGVRKIGPTRFEMRKTNFTPKRDLSILILEPLPPME